MDKKSIVNIALLKKTREKKNISREEMSRLLGYEASNAYYRKEKGDRGFTVDDIAKLSAILGIPIEKIFFEYKVTDKVTKEVG